MSTVKILAINTCTPHASVALLEEGVVLEECLWLQGNSRGVFRQYQNLLAYNTERLLKSCEISLSQIACLAVAVGPGSFTGLRSGVAFAKGLALASEIPVAPVGTLEALAWQAGTGTICPIMDARRGELYWGIYKVDEHGASEVFPCSVSTPSDLVDALQKYEELTLTGEPLRDRDALPQSLRAFPVSLPVTWCLRAQAVGELGEMDFLKGKTKKAEEVLPLYLRGF